MGPKHVAKKPFIDKERILQKFKTAVKTAKVKVVKKKKKLKKEKSKKEEPKVEKEAEKKPEVYVKHGSDLHKAQSGDKGKTTYYHKIGKVPASVKKQTEAELRKHAEKVASAKVEKADEEHKAALNAHKKRVVEHAVRVATPKASELKHKSQARATLKAQNSPEQLQKAVD